MLLKKKLLFLLLLIFSAPLFSHEFWLAPTYFFFQRGEEINVRLRVGEQFTGENWNGNRNDVTDCKLHFADVTDDVSSLLSDSTGDSLQFKIFEEGTAMLTFRNANRFITLSPKEFNHYLEEDGITEAIEFRNAHKETDSSGREYYQRSVKTVLQIGNKLTDRIQLPADLPLDIIPLTHPYRYTQAGSFPVLVLFEGKPLRKKMLRIWQRLAGEVTVKSIFTDTAGKASFQLKPEGEWMISCVAMKRLENDPKADWQSYWGSLTWGYTRNKKQSAILRGRP